MKTTYKFGNGSVLVTASSRGHFIQLTLIKPPLGYIGTIKEKDRDELVEICSIRIKKLTTIQSLSTMLKKRSPFMFEVCDTVLDFTDYPKESFQVVLDACMVAKKHLIDLVYAC